MMPMTRIRRKEGVTIMPFVPTNHTEGCRVFEGSFYRMAVLGTRGNSAISRINYPCFDRRLAYHWPSSDRIEPRTRDQGAAMKLLHGTLVTFSLLSILWIMGSPGRAGEKKASLPADVYKELVAREVKTLEENLKGSPSEDQLARAKLAAVMIAWMAVDAQGGGQAAVEHAAIKTAKLLADKGKIGEARQLAASLTAIKGSVAVLEPIPTVALVGEDVMDTMNHLRMKKKGGDGMHPDLQTSGPLKSLNGLEEKFRSLAKKKLTDANVKKSAKELVLLGYRTAVLAEVVDEYAPKQKKAQQWHELSMQMRDASIELAQAAKKKDAAAIFKAGEKLDSSCTQCHSAFRK
jgi:Cytochrome C'